MFALKANYIILQCDADRQRIYANSFECTFKKVMYKPAHIFTWASLSVLFVLNYTHTQPAIFSYTFTFENKLYVYKYICIYVYIYTLKQQKCSPQECRRLRNDREYVHMPEHS